MGTISKTQSVLHRNPAYDEVFKNVVLFSYKFEEGEEQTDFREVRMLKRDWDDLGNPETITATIEPGDRLNAE